MRVCKNLNRHLSIRRIYRETQYFHQPVQHRYLFQRLLHRDLIRYPPLFKHFGQNFRLSLETVKHSDLMIRSSLFVKGTDPLCQVLRLLKRIVMILYQDLPLLCPVALDPVPKLKEPVRRFQDRGIRSVVHRQSQLLRPEPVLQQKEHILACPAPAVDHLVRVPDCKEFCRFPALLLFARFHPFCSTECLQKIKLQPVAVLNFIHNDPFRMPAVSFSSVRFPAASPAVAQKLRAHPQQIRKGHLILTFLLLFQKRIKPKQVILVSGLVLSRQILLILLLHPLFQPVLILHFQPLLRDDIQRQVRLLVRIHDRKLFRPSRRLHRQPVLQKPERHAVKRPESLHLFRRYTRLTMKKTLRDLIRCLVRKCQNDHIFQRHVFLQMQIQDLLDQHRGLSASHVGIHHTRRAFVQHSCPLIFI